MIQMAPVLNSGSTTGIGMKLMKGSYDPWLVAASLFVAMLASYTALEMAARVSASPKLPARLWMIGGAAALGIGIWSMHFVGMLAFQLPVPMGFNPAETALSLLVAISASLIALMTVRRKSLSTRHLFGGALLMGSGVASMHYMGMAAMRMNPGIDYAIPLVVLSVLIAIGVSGAALFLTFRLGHTGSNRHHLRAGAAVLMGLAIAGMHYTGMAAARFPVHSVCLMAQTGVTRGPLAVMTIGFALLILCMALMGALLDAHLESRTALLARSLTRANEELKFLALHDGLTKLPNRVLLEDRLGQEMRDALREGRQAFAFFIDLDGFKQINDAYGHEAGNVLLIETARRIRASIRDRDTLARIGGDEFVLLIKTHETGHAALCAKKVLSAIKEPLNISGHELRISASIGIAGFTGREASQEEVLRNADAAMYYVKKQGRNGFSFFERSMDEDARSQLETIQDLRLAVERNQLELHYQPIFDMIQEEVTGVEALLRWKHPRRGLLFPGDFIDLAERTGLIVPIGQWVLNEACRQLASWHVMGYQHWTMAVNISTVQFNHPGLRESVQLALQRQNLAPRYLTLEVTESAAMRNAEKSMRILTELRDLGVRISIDDFGTGYSSLSYLKRLPATELKIDRSFVRDLAAGAEDAAIVTAIIALGRNLGLDVLAEGVETTAQRDALIQVGCRSMQGYLIGRAVSAEVFIRSAHHYKILDSERKTRRLATQIRLWASPGEVPVSIDGMTPA
jgi:diguanylate cyclase